MFARSLSKVFVFASILILAAAVMPVVLGPMDLKEKKQLEPQLCSVPTDDGTIIYWLGPDDPAAKEIDDARSQTRGTRAYTLEGTGTHCRIRVDSGCSPYPTQTTIDNLISNFDNIIYPNNINIFGTIPYNKIDIKVLEIDGTWGTGGYFSPVDPDGIHIDNDDISSWGYEILAHEFQHLQHNYYDGGMSGEDLWINEGCSDNAIQFTYGASASGLQSHLGSFENSPEMDLLAFNNAGHDYGSSYAFVQYFWDHYGRNAAVKELVAENQNGADGFNAVLSSRGYDDRFNDVWKKWIVANWIDDTDIYNGTYGYHNQTVHVKTERTHGTYPVTSQNGNVQRYGAQYIMFNPGTTGDAVRFTGTGNCIFQVILIGQNGNPNDVQYLGGAGTYDIGYVGHNYSACVVVIGAYSSQSYSYTADYLDAMPPITTHQITPAVPTGLKNWYVNQPSVELTSNDPSATIFYRIDGAAWDTYTGAVNIPDGNHTFEYYGMDVSSNEEDVRSFNIKVDTERPDTSIILDPEDPDGENDWYVTRPTVSFDAGLEEITFYTINDGPNETYINGFKLTDGKHSIKYWSIDLAGNEMVPKTKQVLVDTTAPEVDILVTPDKADGKSGYYVTSPVVELVLDPADDITGHYIIDDGPTQTYEDPFTLEDGDHTLKYWARDRGNNTSPTHQLSLKVDTIAPQTFITKNPEEPEIGVYNTTVNINFSTSADGIIYYSLNEGDYSKYNPNTDDGTLILEEGEWTIDYYSIDLAGNVEDTNTTTLVIDTSAPSVEMSYNLKPKDNGWFIVVPTVTLESEEGAVIYYSMIDGVYKYEEPFFLFEGENDFSYWAVDPAGNMGPIGEDKALVDSGKPTARLVVPSEGETGEKLKGDGSGSTDASSGVSHYQFDWGDGLVSRWVNDPEMEHSYDKPGEYTVTLIVQDYAGLESEPSIMKIKVTGKEVPEPDDDDDEPKIVISGDWEEKGEDKTDTDEDGLYDWWEESNGLDPEDPDDADEDAINDFQEELDDYNQWLEPDKKEPSSNSGTMIMLFILILVVVIGVGIIVVVVVVKGKKKSKKPAQTPQNAPVSSQGEQVSPKDAPTEPAQASPMETKAPPVATKPPENANDAMEWE